jgi:predicted SprT family Zn-dependent metalloprotease
MIRQDVYLERWDWYVMVYYAVDTYYMDEILEELEMIGCTYADEIEEDLTQHPYNNGLTYSNMRRRVSLIVIGLTETPDEFQNTYDHEKGHLAMHIAEEDRMDVFGEEFQYLTVEIGKQTFPVAKRFMCEHCRKDLVGDF